MEMEGTKTLSFKVVVNMTKTNCPKFLLLLDLVVANTVYKRVYTSRRADPSIKEIDREIRIAKVRSENQSKH